MGRRLTVAILLLVAGTLLITSLVSFLLVRGAANNAAEQQLFTQAQGPCGRTRSATDGSSRR